MLIITKMYLLLVFVEKTNKNKTQVEDIKKCIITLFSKMVQRCVPAIHLDLYISEASPEQLPLKGQLHHADTPWILPSWGYRMVCKVYCSVPKAL